MSSTMPVQSEQMPTESQFRFESLVASICSTLANAGPENIDQRVEQALERIADALGGNRVLLAQTDETTGELVARAQYRSTEPPFPPRLSIRELNPFLWQTLVAGEVASVPDVSALPPSATADRTYFMNIDLRSFLAVPVLIDGALRFMLAVGSTGRRRDWPADAVPRLRVLAEVLASALLRCEAEEVVRESEQLFRAFVEHAPVPIALIPGPDRTPLYFNPAFTQVFGYTREELRAPEDWWPLAFPEPQYRAERLAAWGRHIADGEATGRLQDGSEAEIRTKSGALCYSQNRLALVHGYKLIFFNDLTARRRVEAALRITQYAVDHCPVAVFRIDPAGRFVYANQAACSEFGFSLADLLTKNIWDVSATMPAAEWHQRAEALRVQGGITIESVYRRKDESTFPVELHIHHVQFSGQDSYFCFALNISARRAAQEAAHHQLKRLEALAGELSRSEERQRRELARILHDEIGQNLFAVTAQLLALQNRLPAEKDALGKVLALLDGISQDTRNLTYELCPPILYQLGLGPALQRLVDQLAKIHGIAFTLDGGGAGPLDLNVRGLVYHAARELLNNVAKHSRATSATLRVAENNGHLSICVEDNGRGYNVAQADAKKGGFGLFYLRERISLLGGTLVIENAPAGGCRVLLELPLYSPAPE